MFGVLEGVKFDSGGVRSAIKEHRPMQIGLAVVEEI